MELMKESVLKCVNQFISLDYQHMDLLVVNYAQ